MLVRLRKSQSTAEYAITLGLIIAVVTGVLGAALKAGMRTKGGQAVELLRGSGIGDAGGIGALSSDFAADRASIAGMLNATTSNIALYNQQYRNTAVGESTSTNVMQRGGGETKISNQSSTTTSVEVETLGSIGNLTN